MKLSIKLHYNSPVILSFSIACTATFILNSIFGGGLDFIFSLNDFSFVSPVSYLNLVLYVLGHAGTDHLLGNLVLLLLLGPILEERYGSVKIAVMMGLTALITGILNILLFNTGIMGASGIVFMFIVLISFTNVKEGYIPLTFILIVLLFIGKEVLALFDDDNISQFGHIIGGACGSLFGFSKWIRPENQEMV